MRLQTSTRKPEDMRMQGWKQVYMSLRRRGCKDKRIQAGAHKHKDLRERVCKDTSQCTRT